MERERGSKIIAIIALCVGIVGLSLGFAAFSSNLKISSSATVSPAATNFNVDFSSSSTAIEAGQITATPTGGATADKATISNTSIDSSISGLKAKFTEPGQTVTYSFYAFNESPYAAYLKTVTFNNATGSDKNKKCTAGAGASASYVDSACEGISIKVEVGADANKTEYITSKSGITEKNMIAKNASVPVVVTITYAEGSAEADGDFTVEFGDIAFAYSSAQ